MHTQLDFTIAEDAKRIGMLLSEDNANLRTPGWSDMAMGFLMDFLDTRTDSFLAEEVRAYASDRGLDAPPSNRAWGGVMARASRNGLIRSVGFALTSNPLAHNTPATLWEKA